MHLFRKDTLSRPKRRAINLSDVTYFIIFLNEKHKTKPMKNIKVIK